MSKNTMRLSLGGYEMTVTQDEMRQLYQMKSHASWVPGTIERIVEELIDIGSSSEDVNHRSIIGHLKDLKEIAADFQFLGTVSILELEE